MLVVQEDHVGASADEVVAWSLIVCFAVLCQLNDGRVAAAHFTPATPRDEIEAGLEAFHQRIIVPSAIAQLYMVMPASAPAWRANHDIQSGYAGMVASVRRRLRYNGAVWFADRDWLPGNAPRVDIRLLSVPPGGDGADAITYRRRDLPENLRPIDPLPDGTKCLWIHRTPGSEAINPIPATPLEPCEAGAYAPVPAGTFQPL